MTILETRQDHYFIDRKHFDICIIDGKTKEEIRKIYPLRAQGAYYLDKFVNYLKDVHNIGLVDYCEKYFYIKWPMCPTKKIKCGVRAKGIGFIISMFSAGGVNKKNCPAFAKGCEKLSQDRMGDKNPLWGKEPWNKGIDSEHPWAVAQSKRMKGNKVSEDTRRKQRLAREKSPVKSRHTQKHTEESKEKMRAAAIARIARGDFEGIRSRIQIKVFEFLSKNYEGFIEEFPIGVFLLDFAFGSAKVGIEVQGGYFHSDPRIWINGPITKTQKKNWYRDKRKREYLASCGWELIEIWESEINSGEFEEILKCKLKKLLE
jgi:very-short-patch-repair endonuclease